MSRIPHGYHDPERIAADVERAGFPAPRMATVARRSRAGSAGEAAEAFCRGTPLADEIAARDESRRDAALSAAEAEITRRFGGGPVDAKMQAHVVTARRP